jgi:hypothetical protein
MTFVTTSNGRTVLVDEAVEAGASWPAVEPEHEGVLARVALRLHQVVEHPAPELLVHRHVPGVVLRRELGALEPREASHQRVRRRGAAAADEGCQQLQEDEGCCRRSRRRSRDRPRPGHCCRPVSEKSRSSTDGVPEPGRACD